jgi:hypothetical protein
MSRHKEIAALRELTLIRRQHLLAALTLSTLLLSSSSTGAAVWVEVHSGTVVVDAIDASVAEVLAALGKSTGLHYRTSTVLSRTISGTYKGTLRQVVSRLLNGYNYSLKVSDGSVEASIVGLAGLVPITDQLLSAAAPQVTASRATETFEPTPPANAYDSSSVATKGNNANAPPSRRIWGAVDLAAQLRAAAIVQIAGGTASTPVTSSPMSSNPESSNIAALTQQARAQLSELISSLASAQQKP